MTVEKNENQSEDALKKSNEGVNTAFDNKPPTPSTEINMGESPQPSAEASAQAANLILSASQQLFQASRLEPRLGDYINKALSMLQEGIRPLAETDSKTEPVLNYTEIIKEIMRNLTGDGEKDSKYLMEQIEKYRYHEYGIEILKALHRMVYGFLPEEAKAELSTILKKDNSYIQVILNEVKSKLAEHNLEEAEKLILEILPSQNSFYPDKVTKYYDFKNSLEWAYFMAKYRPTKEIYCSPISYNDVFMTYAYILVEKEDYDKAIQTIDTGLRINPLHIDLMFEKASIYKNQKRFEESLQISRDCFDIAYRRVHIARCYRDFGYYFIENKNWEAAICCHLLSNHWFQTEKAKSELYFISQQTRKVIDEEYYAGNLDRILQENGVPLEPNHLWIEISSYLGETMVSKNNIEDAKFCYNVAYELTGNDSYHEKILELNKNLQ
jgi:hypothetical protein